MKIIFLTTGFIFLFPIISFGCGNNSEDFSPLFYENAYRFNKKECTHFYVMFNERLGNKEVSKLGLNFYLENNQKVSLSLKMLKRNGQKVRSDMCIPEKYLSSVKLEFQYSPIPEDGIFTPCIHVETVDNLHQVIQRIDRTNETDKVHEAK